MEKYGHLPSLSEVARVASLFDEMGDYESACLLDDYLEKASEFKGDLVKQAGFWGNVWKRMKGKAKTWFISEYKELHDAAKEAQAKIEERIEKLVEEGKKLKKDFKNYELGTWHQRIENCHIMNSEDILYPFNRKYGKFLKYITQFEDKKPEDAEISESDRIIGKTDLTTKDIESVDGWSPVSRRMSKELQINSDTGEIRISLDWWNGVSSTIKGTAKDYFTSKKGILHLHKDLISGADKLSALMEKAIREVGTILFEKGKTSANFQYLKPYKKLTLEDARAALLGSEGSVAPSKEESSQSAPTSEFPAPNAPPMPVKEETKPPGTSGVAKELISKSPEMIWVQVKGNATIPYVSAHIQTNPEDKNNKIEVFSYEPLSEVKKSKNRKKNIVEDAQKINDLNELREKNNNDIVVLVGGPKPRAQKSAARKDRMAKIAFLANKE